MAVKLFRVIFLVLILLQIAKMGYRNSVPALESTSQNVHVGNAAAPSFLDNLDAATKGVYHLYSPEPLLLPDALLSPIPYFQFGLIEILACFLFVISFLHALKKVKEVTFFFYNSYFHTLFSSTILINAP